MKRPISTPSTSTRNVAVVTRWPSKPSSGIEQRLPCALVHLGDELHQARPIGMLEIEQPVQVPVEVIGEVADLLPERRLGVELHDPPSTCATATPPGRLPRYVPSCGRTSEHRSAMRRRPGACRVR